MSERPYSRVYWEVRSDDRFVGIYGDNHHLSTWLRLLIAADMAWPAPADIPASCRKSSLAALVDAGLIDVLPGHLYRVHGLDRERNERSQKARDSVMHRYSDRTTTVERSKYERSTSRAEPSQDEPSQAETPRADDPASTYWNLTGKFPSDKTLAWIDDLTEQYGADAVNRHLGGAHQSDSNVRTLLGRVQDLCRVDERQLSLNERAVEKTRITERRRDPNVVRAYHQAGQHVEAPDPTCALCQKGAA